MTTKENKYKTEKTLQDVVQQLGDNEYKIKISMSEDDFNWICSHLEYSHYRQKFCSTNIKILKSGSLKYYGRVSAKAKIEFKSSGLMVRDCSPYLILLIYHTHPDRLNIKEYDENEYGGEYFDSSELFEALHSSDLNLIKKLNTYYSELIEA